MIQIVLNILCGILKRVSIQRCWIAAFSLLMCFHTAIGCGRLLKTAMTNCGIPAGLRQMELLAQMYEYYS